MTLRRIPVALTVLFLAAAPVHAQVVADRASSKFLAPFRKVVATSNESTVRIRCDDKDAVLGTIVFADGYILTKASELKGTITVRLKDGAEYEAEIISSHKATDLALLKVDVSGLKAVNFADSKKISAGSWLAAAGPSSDATAAGIVSVKTRTVPVDPFERMMNENRGYLGAYLEDAKDESGKIIGATVSRFSENSAARKAGVKRDDIIIAVNNKTVAGRTSLQEMLDSSSPNQKVTLKLMREGKEMNLSVTLGGPEKSRGDIQNSMGSELSGRRTGFPAVLQTDMVVEPRNCGGPVVDLDGNVLGINIARAGRVETWVLPSENIRPLLVDMKAGKFPPISTKKEKDTSK